MNFYRSYAECIICKNQDGPWVLENQKFYCEECYEKYRKEKNEQNIKINRHYRTKT